MEKDKNDKGIIKKLTTAAAPYALGATIAATTFFGTGDATNQATAQSTKPARPAASEGLEAPYTPLGHPTVSNEDAIKAFMNDPQRMSAECGAWEKYYRDLAKNCKHYMGAPEQVEEYLATAESLKNLGAWYLEDIEKAREHEKAAKLPFEIGQLYKSMRAAGAENLDAKYFRKYQSYARIGHTEGNAMAQQFADMDDYLIKLQRAYQKNDMISVVKLECSPDAPFVYTFTEDSQIPRPIGIGQIEAGTIRTEVKPTTDASSPHAKVQMNPAEFARLKKRAGVLYNNLLSDCNTLVPYYKNDVPKYYQSLGEETNGNHAKVVSELVDEIRTALNTNNNEELNHTVRTWEGLIQGIGKKFSVEQQHEADKRMFFAQISYWQGATPNAKQAAEHCEQKSKDFWKNGRGQNAQIIKNIADKLAKNYKEKDLGGVRAVVDGWRKEIKGGDIQPDSKALFLLHGDIKEYQGILESLRQRGYDIENDPENLFAKTTTEEKETTAETTSQTITTTTTSSGISTLMGTSTTTVDPKFREFEQRLTATENELEDTAVALAIEKRRREIAEHSLQMEKKRDVQIVMPPPATSSITAAPTNTGNGGGFSGADLVVAMAALGITATGVVYFGPGLAKKAKGVVRDLSASSDNTPRIQSRGMDLRSRGDGNEYGR